MTADLLGAFAHTGQTPVTGAIAAGQDVRVDAHAIVSDADAKKFLTIGDFRFNIFGVSVGEGVAQSFADDAIDFVADDGIERPGRALFENIESGRVSPDVRDGKLTAESVHGLGEIFIDERSGANVVNGVATFDDGLLGAGEGAIEALNSLIGIGGKQIAGALEMQHQTLKTLQQRVVQFAGDAGAFREALLVLEVEARGDLLDVALIGEPNDDTGEERGEQEKPFGLIKLRNDIDGQGRAGFTPDAVTIGGDDAESVGAGTEIGIDGVAGGGGFAPIAIEAVEAIAVADAFRDGEAEAGESEGEAVTRRRNAHRAGEIDGSAIGQRRNQF